ncbi:hypothetical protein CHS0354_014668 [Potamilus streckersoni]|uniref:DUF11 domain-containing protein n=1 Tax=Potamilus streckersoni TaxID=2493646 RepID=A0AAE0VZG2_9BIVA|nr:hypothetical protein CHS0354_014668 [Potamilus streckersoni]
MRSLYYRHWLALLLLLGQVLQVSGNASSANTTYKNISFETFLSSSGYSTLNCSITHLVNSPTSPSSVGQRASVVSINNSTITYPRLNLTMAIEVSSTVQVFIQVSNIGNGSAHSVLVRVDLTQGLKAYYGTFPNSSNITYNDRLKFNWSIGMLNENASVSLSFEAEASKDILQAGFNYFDASCTYKGSGNASDEYGPFIAEVGLKRINTYKDNLFYQQGFTVLSFFMALILGFLLVILGFFIYFMIRRKKMVSPDQGPNDKKLLRNKGRQIMLSEDEALKKGGHTIHGFSTVSADESIVSILGMRDKMQMHREIDSSDILSTIDVDTSIEEERNNISDVATVLLIQGFRFNNDITKAQEDAVISNYKRKRSQMDKTQDDEYKRELKRLYKKIAAKNRAMMAHLMQRQRAEENEVANNLRDLPEKERTAFLELLDKQHQTEQDEETYRLKLQQDEESEKLRKEFAVRKRMGLKELHLQLMQDTKEQGQLSKKQADWLMNEHRKNQKGLEKLYDEEISRQRMVLEEKLARRKNLAHMSESHEDDQTDILNTMAGHHLDLLVKLKKQGMVDASQAAKLTEEARQELLAIKDKFEKEKLRQEAELHKRLSLLKKQRLSALANQHQLELSEFDKKHQGLQAEGPVDPLFYAEERLKILSQQRIEKNNIENELDEEHAQELTTLRKEIETQTEDELKKAETRLREKLPSDEKTLDSVQRLLKQHDKELRELRAGQNKNRQLQMVHFEEKLAKNRESWNQRKEAEKVEQQQLRDYEDRVVRKLINSQVTMSDEDRDRILKEHEKHMVQLENSLTLNKLRQKRMVEEKLALKRARQLEKLQQKQEMEREKQQRAIDNNAEESDEDSKKAKVELMKKHVEQKVSVLHGQKLSWDEEMENIRIEMVKERTLSLKEQEERLGAMIASLQMEKAKQLAKIEEQQRAIHGLKSNLINDLSDRGILSNPECQAFLNKHYEQREQLNSKIEAQKDKQEKVLKKRLQERLEQREKSMLEAQDAELRNLVAPNKTATKIKKMLLIHKHMVDMENFRNQLDREISQTLEEVQRQNEIVRMQALQEQELQFIGGLVKIGQFNKEELNTVLGILYPHKTDADISDILVKIYDPRTVEKDGNTTQQATHLSRKTSSLVSRIQAAQMPTADSRPSSRLSDTQSAKKSIKKKKPSLASEDIYNHSALDEDISEQYNRTAHAHYTDDEEIVEAEMIRRPQPARLPPLSTGTDKKPKKKKKKNFLKKAQTIQDDDDDLL